MRPIHSSPRRIPGEVKKPTATVKYRSLKDPSKGWAGRGPEPSWLMEEMKETGKGREAFKTWSTSPAGYRSLSVPSHSASSPAWVQTWEPSSCGRSVQAVLASLRHPSSDHVPTARSGICRSTSSRGFSSPHTGVSAPRRRAVRGGPDPVLLQLHHAV
ncbi:H-NS histone family protein [Bradyrhizobium sp. 141]|nr:H-NS histone family protein [Bradyrhizobium sp. 141]